MNFTFDVADRNFNIDIDKHKIQAIILFGSYVNKDFTEKSDIDLLFIIKYNSTKDIFKKQFDIAQELGVPAYWINLYFDNMFLSRCLTGDLFYWYLKIYGNILYCRTQLVQETFKIMPLYEEIEENVAGRMQDVDSSFLNYMHQKTPYKSCIITLAKHIRAECIDICYINGDLCFDRTSAISKCDEYENVHLDFSKEQYLELMSIKNEILTDSEYKLPYDEYIFIMTWYKRYCLLANLTLEEYLKNNQNERRCPLIPYLG